MLHSISQEQRLYVLKAGHGFSCLGFDVAEKRRLSVLQWIGDGGRACPWPSEEIGTEEHYSAYRDAMERGERFALGIGSKCPAELNPALIGLEGKRVEISAPDGTRERFYVSRSMGWMPCHIATKTRRSLGGCTAYIPQGASVRVVG